MALLERTKGARMAQRSLAGFALVALVACTGASSDPSPPPQSDAGILDTRRDREIGAPDVSDGSTEAPVRFRIQVDYRFDTEGFFQDPVRQEALLAACRIWGRRIATPFPNVPAGTFIRVRDPQLPDTAAGSLTLDYEIDDLVIFVGAAELSGGTLGKASPTAGLSGVTDEALRKSLSDRYYGDTFQPWTAWITFDKSTPFHFDPQPEQGNPVPADTVDFVSVALHEIGHALGFGTAPVFDSKVEGTTFVGARAVALYGAPVPLTTDLGHVPNSTLWQGSRLLMDQSDAKGQRYLPTALDEAMFEDLGYRFAGP